MACRRSRDKGFAPARLLALFLREGPGRGCDGLVLRSRILVGGDGWNLHCFSRARLVTVRLLLEDGAVEVRVEAKHGIAELDEEHAAKVLAQNV